MSTGLFDTTQRNGREILFIKPAPLTNPGSRILCNLTYEIEDRSRLNIRSGVVLKDERHINIADIIEIVLTRSVAGTVLGVGAADLTFRTSSPIDFKWENVRNATKIRDFIYELRDQRQSAGAKAGTGKGTHPDMQPLKAPALPWPKHEELLSPSLQFQCRPFQSETCLLKNFRRKSVKLYAFVREIGWNVGIFLLDMG